jgi:hypothetical protein
MGDGGWDELAASKAESRYLRIEGLRDFFFDRGRLCSGDCILEVDSADIEELDELEVPSRFDELDAKVESELEDDPWAV